MAKGSVWIGVRIGVMLALMMRGESLADAPLGTPPDGGSAAPSPGSQAPPSLTITGLECTGGGILGSHEAKPHNDAPGEAHTRSECELGQRLLVTISADSLEKWKDDPHSKNDPKRLELILDGRLLKGVYGDAPGPGDTTFRFDLKRLSNNEDSRSAWNTILSHTKHRSEVKVALGFKGDPVSDSNQGIILLVFPSYGWAVAMFFLALVVAFVCLAVMSDIIRDQGLDPAPGQRRCYSLGRSQMAWWFFVVLASFLYIWMVTGDYDTITAGALILTGISAATGLGAAVVESTERSDDIQRQADLRKQQTDLKSQIDALDATEAKTAALEARQKELQGNTELTQNEKKELAILQAQIGSRPAERTEFAGRRGEKQQQLETVTAELNRLTRLAPKSTSFVLDILRDDAGVSFHRFQIAGWTLVLSIVFVVGVLKDLAMPDFSATLLGLMGISSGTYLGFKLPGAVKSTAAPGTEPKTL